MHQRARKEPFDAPRAALPPRLRAFQLASRSHRTRFLRGTRRGPWSERAKASPGARMVDCFCLRGLGGARGAASPFLDIVRRCSNEKKAPGLLALPPLGSWLSFTGRWHGVSTSKGSDEGAGASRLVSGACQTRGMGAAEVLHDDLPSSAILSPPSQQPRPLSSTALSSSSKTKNRPATPPPAPVSSSTAPTAPCEFVFSVVYFGGRFIFFVFRVLAPRPSTFLGASDKKSIIKSI